MSTSTSSALTATSHKAGGSGSYGVNLPWESVCQCARARAPRKHRTHSNKMPFLVPEAELLRVHSIFCRCFEALLEPSAHNDRNRKPQKMERLWEKFGIADGQPLFELMRLTLPHLDTLRPNYRLKQKALAKMYVEILAIPESSDAAQQILNWKKPASGFQRNEQGNFPEVVNAVIKERFGKRSELASKGAVPLTVGELNAFLDRLAHADQFADKKSVFHDMVTRTTAREQRWILRVILKDMQIGMKEDSVFKLLHPDAKELYAAHCDLKETCELCIDPDYRHKDISIGLFRPLKPRLAARTDDWRAIHKGFHKKGQYVAEYKLDGERLMLHFKRRGRDDGSDRAEWFTRNQKNFTGWYGESMSKVLKECLKPEVDEVILDGEMMVWNCNTCEYAAFGENRSLGDYRTRIEQGFQPCYVVFDCVWLNGRAISEQPLRERRAAIDNMVTWSSHSMELSEVSVVEPRPSDDGAKSSSHDNEVMNALDRALARGYEGIVFKGLETTYTPGARDNDWVKLKPDYVREMGDTLDLIILAGYYGEGNKRGGAISHFLMGVEAPASERMKWGTKTDKKLFYPFCKVGTGYSASRLVELRSELEPATHPWHKHRRPAHLCGWVPNKTDDEPDVWFDPSMSFLMTVRAYEIVKTEAFLPCGMTLRFPRSTGIRRPDDKAWFQCEKHDDILTRYRDGKAQISHGKRKAADVARDAEANPSMSTKRLNKKGAAAAAAPKVGVSSQFRIDRTALDKHRALAKDGGLFRDVVAVVRGQGANDPAHPRSRASLQTAIASLGGEVNANPIDGVTTLIVDADDVPSGQVRGDMEHARKKAATYDIVCAQWVLDCAAAVERGEEVKVGLEPRYVRYASADTLSAMATTMDEWGDRYFIDSTRDALAQAMTLVRADRKQKQPQPPQPPQPSQQPPQKKQRGGSGVILLQEEEPPPPSYALTLGSTAGGATSGGGAMVTSGGGARGGETVDVAWLLGQIEELADDVGELKRGPGACLLGVVAYAPRAATRLRLRIAGAQIADAPSSHVTHAVLPDSSLRDGTCAKVRHALSAARVAEAGSSGALGVSAWVVGESWVAACEEAGMNVEEVAHALKEARA